MTRKTSRNFLIAISMMSTFSLVACQSSGAPPAPSPANAPTGVTPNTFSMPSGSGCSGEIARFQAVMDNDLDTGHTTKGVHATVSAEISSARAACLNGKDAGAMAQIRTTKGKFGYP